MPTLPIAVHNYPAGSVAVASPLSVSWLELIKFAVSCGGPIFASTSTPQHASIALAAYKGIALACALDIASPHVAMAPGYESLDPTEKANISFWTGMIVASLVAQRALGVAQLLHATAYRGIVRAVPSSRVLADLIGQDPSGDWHVLEAKGRVRASARALGRWKSQAGSISAIDGKTPTTCSVCVTNVGASYSVDLIDPPIERGPIVLELSREDFARRYYDPVVQWLSDDNQTVEDSRRGVRARLAAFNPVTSSFVWVGATLDLLNASSRINYREREREGGGLYAGTDGIVVLESTDRRSPFQPSDGIQDATEPH